jgi:hypothetical protein
VTSDGRQARSARALRSARHSPLVTHHCSSGGQGRVRTSVDRRGRQIYSLLLLTTQPPVRPSSPSKVPLQAHAQGSAPPPESSSFEPSGSRKRLGAETPIFPRNSECFQILVNPLPSFPTDACLLNSFAAPLAQPGWSWRRDLNPRPSDYKSDALPAELRQPLQTYYYTNWQSYCKGNCKLFSSAASKGLLPLPLPKCRPSASPACHPTFTGLPTTRRLPAADNPNSRSEPPGKVTSIRKRCVPECIAGDFTLDILFGSRFTRVSISSGLRGCR